MCLAVPLKLTFVEGKEAIGEIDGVKRKVRVDFITNPAVGDYVLVHAGFAIQKIDEKQAKENMDIIKEVTDAL